MVKRGFLWALPLGWLAYAALFASSGAFTIDEIVYGAMIERFALDGSFTIPNGYETEPSLSLLLKLLVPGLNGLVAQYPAGYAIVAAPFFLIGGLDGVVFLNALASAGLFALTYLLGRKLFDDTDLALNAALIFGLATFAIEYALGIWPHALGAWFLVLAAYLVASSVYDDRRSAVYAALGGLILGLGVNVRLDVILVAPALVVWFLGNSRITNGALPFVAALTPGLAIASGLNYAKFGLLTPFTYGEQDLGEARHLVSANNYAELLPLACLGGVVVAAFCFRRFRNLFVGWRGAVLALAGAVAAITIPGVSEPSLKILRGLYVLLVDLQAYDYIERQAGVDVIDGAWLLFWGVTKKALFVSLPFLGLLLLPMTKLFQPGGRNARALCFFCPLCIFAFFALNQWHGGFSSNMRYFVPALPFLALLSADAWREVQTATFSRRPAAAKLAFTVGTAVLVSLTVYGFALAASGRLLSTPAVQSLTQGSLVIFAASLLLSTLFISVPRLQTFLKGALRATSLAGFAAAFLWAYPLDTGLSQTIRSANEDLGRAFSAIERDALVVTSNVGPFGFQLLRDTAWLSVLNERRGLDVDLVEGALAAGRPVYVYPEQAADVVASDLGPGYLVVPVTTLPRGLCRLKQVQKEDTHRLSDRTSSASGPR